MGQSIRDSGLNEGALAQIQQVRHSSSAAYSCGETLAHIWRISGCSSTSLIDQKKGRQSQAFSFKT
jgi:hypothetical protein